MKLWQKKLSKSLHPLIEQYTVGEDYLLDRVLMPYDLLASQAHAQGLKNIGILTTSELEKMTKALSDIGKEYSSGKIEITSADEDCHTVIEQQLIAKLGNLGKKIHTGRSRNDQVLVALRLYEKDQLKKIAVQTKKLAEAFFHYGKEYKTTPLPGYSHTQQAMPSSIAHWAFAHRESLADDAILLGKILDHIDQNPLGSAAGFGVNLPLDREHTTKALGFKKTQVNSLYCQNSRGKFESVILEGLSQVMMSLSRFASDMIFFTSRECEYFSVDESLTTGSSIMPQKKNHDALEMLRANAGKISSHHFFVQQLGKNLISGYHRDFQLVKQPLIESFEIVIRSLEIAALYLTSMTPDQKKIEASMKPDMLTAEIATELASEKGIPFRDAYSQALDLMKKKKPDWEKSIATKISLGGPGSYHSSVPPT